jgi:hypothetical protein
MFLQILAVIAEFEANLIRQRTREGMDIARQYGRLGGKQPSLKPPRTARSAACLVERAVLEDVDLDPRQDPERRQGGVQLADQLQLGAEPASSRSVPARTRPASSPGLSPATTSAARRNARTR